jgi:transposase-like protein
MTRRENYMSILCKSCGCDKNVKNGFVHEVQRYKCKECGMNFVEGDKRQKYTLTDRLKVLKLYLENCGIRSIERLTGIRNRQISLWIETAAEDIKRKLEESQKNINRVQDIAIMELDELCTYIKKDQETAENLPSYGLLLIENQIKLLILR